MAIGNQALIFRAAKRPFGCAWDHTAAPRRQNCPDGEWTGEQSPTHPSLEEESGPRSVFRCICFYLVINMNTMKNNQMHANVSGNIPFMDAMGLVHGYLNGKCWVTAACVSSL